MARKVENKAFNVDYEGWENKTKRSYQDVRELFANNGQKMFEYWALTALFGAKICINGINIECVPPDHEVRKRTIAYFELP